MPVAFLKKISAVFAVLAVLAGVALLPVQKSVAAKDVPYLQTMAEVYQAVGNTKTPVLIQFDAKWCGYCKALKPHIQKLYDTTARKRLEIYKVDIDDAPDIAANFGVSALPALFIVHQAKPVAVQRGGMDERTLFDWVNRTLEQL